MFLHVGFTGSARGMTDYQRAQVIALLTAHGLHYPVGSKYLHHGDCIGSDAMAHTLALGLGYNIHLHPPSNPRARAFCTGWVHCEPEQPYMVRNQSIVDWAEVMLATPSRLEVSQPHSGTWATVRRARRKGIMVHSIGPTGELL